MRHIRSEGGCLCGEIRYRVEGPVLGSAACHCRDCQYVCGGAPAYVILVARSSLQLLKGKPVGYGNTAESGAKRLRQFCGTCGTPLFAEDEKYPGVLSIKVGSLDDPSQFKPEAQFWTASAPSWHAIDPSVPRLPKGPGSM